MKKTVSLVALCFFSLTFIFSSCSASTVGAKSVHFYLNDILVEPRTRYDLPYIDKNNQMIVPLELICQMSGLEFSVDSSDKSATVKLDDKFVTLKANSKEIMTSDGSVEMLSKAILKKDIFYVPAEPVLSSLGYTITAENTEEGNIVRANGKRGKAKYQTEIKKESFDTDPGIYGERNEINEAAHDVVSLDFGYKNYKGENVIGGIVQRYADKSYYALNLPEELTFEDKITFSGKFAVPNVVGSSGVLFGLFNKNSKDYRTNNYMCMRVDGDAPKRYFVYFEYGTKDWKPNWVGCFSNPRYQDSRGDNPGDPDDRLQQGDEYHSFSLTYDPSGNAGTVKGSTPHADYVSNGEGSIVCTLDDKTYSFNLLEGHKESGAVFNQFGILTQMHIGRELEVYYKDLTLNGVKIDDLSPQGGWEAYNNVLVNQKVSYGRGVCEYGYRDTNFAGDKSGEFGGIIWRLDENRFNTPAYAGVKTGILDLSKPLHAKGKINLTGVGKDSALVLGWFNSKTPEPDRNFVRDTGPRNSIGAFVEGLSVDGHYFRPIYAGSSGKGDYLPNGPIMRPTVTYNWTIDYKPNDDGTGLITTTLNGQAVELAVPKDVVESSVFDSFGVVSYVRGGMYIKFAIDDIEYTVRK